MYKGKTVFSQVMDFILIDTFRRRVKKYKGDHKVKIPDTSLVGTE
jgi:hypothetical protein